MKRRTFKLIACLAGLGIAGLVHADSFGTSRAPVLVQPAAPPQARPFPLGDVRVLEGPFREGQDAAVRWLLSLDPDRFLANFRAEAGLEPRAEHYPGWERQGVSGHSAGHYLSACAIGYAVTGDQRFLERVVYLVRELAECQAAHGDGYVAAIPNGRQVYAEVAAGDIRSSGFDLNGCWVPNYTMHKLFAGLRDAYRLADHAPALEVAIRLADWFEKIHANLTEEQMQAVMVAEYGGLNETFADLCADTGEVRYLALARRFHHRAVLDPLARGEDILPGHHANTQIPKLTGLATLYELDGRASDRRAAEFFWDRVVNHHSYVTGGHCDHEYFGPPDRLNDRLSPATTETCNVYNMLKLTRHVFGWNPVAAVADFNERALLNHMRASQHPDGRVIYNLSLQPGHHKEYQRFDDWWTCCMGTGMESHLRYGEAIYFHDDEGLWVNLFIPSQVHWRRGDGVVLHQETQFPMAGRVMLTLRLQGQETFTLRVRHPHWAAHGMRIAVNGEEQAVESHPSSYAELRRSWRGGDRVEITLPMTLRTESMPDNAQRIGIFYGPTLLAADLGPVNNPKAVEPGFVPVLLTDDRSVRDWVEAVPDKPLTFRSVGVGRPHDVELVPFFLLHDRRYTVYLDLFTAEGWARREAGIRAEKEREQRLTARTLDALRVGEMQPERDHNLQGERTGAGEALGRRWRHAVDGGWFSFELTVEPGQSAELLCTYWGGDSGNRVFDLIVEGQRIATQRLQADHPGQFFDVTYPIPGGMIEGRERVTIRFQAHPGAMAGGLFGARMLRAEEKAEERK
jgi:uncharacterized protein